MSAPTASDLCVRCGHERGEHLPPCEAGISTGRPCGCRQFVDDLLARLHASITSRQERNRAAPDTGQRLGGENRG